LRGFAAVLALAASAFALPAGASAVPSAVTTVRAPGDAAGVVAIVRQAMEAHDLRAVIVRVTVDGKSLVTRAFGESMTGVPATTDMHFRNGAVSISYMANLLLQLVDDGRVSLDDKVSTWLPELPEADHVTLRMLANMTSGYTDYVFTDAFLSQLYADPFKLWTTDEQFALGLAQPRLFEPGTNWDYSHFGYVILGRVLEKVTGKPLATALRERVLRPLGLRNTRASTTAAIPEPVLHAFSSERREWLGIDPSVRFYEESTFWNPSWTLAHGAIETSNIYDLATTAVAVGEGKLLSRESHRAQIAPDLLGFGSPLAGCHSCHTLDTTYDYGLGVVLSGAWILQNPLFAGFGSIEAYLPSKKIAIAVATTYGEGSFDEHGGAPNYADTIFRSIGAYLAPAEPPPTGT